MSSIARWINRVAKAGFIMVHNVLLRAGVIVLPNHYYAPVADVRQLSATRKYWAVRAPMRGIDTEPQRQIAWLRDHVHPFESEYRGNRRFLEGVAAGYGLGYGYIEAQCLHGVVRSLKPRRIIEVGSGVSSHVMLGALERNNAEDRPGSLTCIEPYPSKFLRATRGIELIAAPVEQLDPAVFDVLEAGDMLFIDSAHAVRPGGDVVFLYLSVIPRLKAGILIHIHDIFFPYLHQRDLLTSLFQWEETALLGALLTDNSRLRIECCQSQLHYDDPEGLRTIFPEYRPASAASDGLIHGKAEGHFPASVFLMVC